MNQPLTLTAAQKAGPKLTAVALGIVQCTGERVRLALRLRVFVYPDDVCAVWAMLASTHRPSLAQ